MFPLFFFFKHFCVPPRSARLGQHAKRVFFLFKCLCSLVLAHLLFRLIWAFLEKPDEEKKQQTNAKTISFPSSVSLSLSLKTKKRRRRNKKLTLVTLKDPEGRWLSRHIARILPQWFCWVQKVSGHVFLFFFSPMVSLCAPHRWIRISYFEGNIVAIFCLFVLRNNEKEELISKLNLVAGTHDQKPVGFPCFRLVSSTLFIFLYLFIYTRFGFESFIHLLIRTHIIKVWSVLFFLNPKEMVSKWLRTHL